jgi:hypothetical protein
MGRGGQKERRATTFHDARRIWRSLATAIVALALLMALGATSASAAAPDCRVQNTITGKTYKALQPAVDAAKRGDRLTVKGLCRGGTVIDGDLVIVGLQTPTSVTSTLSGVGRTRVVKVEVGVRVKMRSLVIVRGGEDGCILNRGSLTLADVLVHDCGVSDCCGSGAYNHGRLTLNGASRISRSGPTGVQNFGTLVMNGTSSISRNWGIYGGGVSNLGTITMNGSSSIGDNHAEEYGGVNNFGTITMNDASSIRGNWDWYQVGGVYNGAWRGHRGALTMNDSSSISGNDGTDSDAGGVRIEGGVVTMNDASTISGNNANWLAGGVRLEMGRFTMNDTSSISGNTSWQGGGVSLEGGRFTMNDASSITGNEAAEIGDPDPYGEIGDGGGGGGVSHSRGTLKGVICAPEAGANVYGNTPDDCHIGP